MRDSSASDDITQRNFQKHFSEIKPVGLALCASRLALEILRLLFDFGLFFCVALGFLAVVFLHFIGLRFVLKLDHRKQVHAHLVIVAPNVLGLVIGPLVAGLGLVQHFLCMRAVPQQRNDRDAHRENGHRDGNGSKRRVFPGVFGIFLKLAQFVRHEFSSSIIRSLGIGIVIAAMR